MKRFISVSDGVEFFQRVEVKDFKHLGELACESNISTSVFGGDGKRNRSNFEFADFIGVDIDNDGRKVDGKSIPIMTIEQAKEAFKEYKFIIVPSRSHQKSKNGGEPTDRFRVILPLEKRITNSDDFYATWFSLQAKFPAIDPQCKDPSRYWWKHQRVEFIKGDGIRVQPVKHTPKVKSVEELSPFDNSEKGKLGKSTLEFLEFGVGAGSRNGTVHKVARDFLQNLYSREETETRILASLYRNNVIADDFTEAEAMNAIESAFNKEATHEPRLEERLFKYRRVGELLAEKQDPLDWIVDRLLVRGAVSLVVGEPKTGKTTLVRQLERCVLRGETFLGRKTEAGKVMHFSFDEKARTSRAHYESLGLTDSDDLLLHYGMPQSKDFLGEFEEDLTKQSPVLVVVDTLADLLGLEDLNNYSVVKQRMSRVSAIAANTKSHIMFIHHANKPNQHYRKGSGNLSLGSQAITGSVDCFFIFEKEGKGRILSCEGRDIEPFDHQQLKFNKETMTYEIDDTLEHPDDFE